MAAVDHPSKKDDSDADPNYFHNINVARRGPKKVPNVVAAITSGFNLPKDPGHPYASTEHVFFQYFEQRASNAPFGYEHFVSLPPAYETDQTRPWPLILFLHGYGQAQHDRNESYRSIRHGIPKVVLCYDRLKAEPSNRSPTIAIPRATQTSNTKQPAPLDSSGLPVAAEVCTLLTENFITVTPSLDMAHGYGWSPPILSALLDEIVDRYRIDPDRIHVTGFSMGGYGTWALGMHDPHRFASLMPICGGGDPRRVDEIKHIPQWVHHGDMDNRIPVKASTQMVDALAEVDAKDVRYTRYPTLMHDSWTEAYNNPQVYEWMLAARRHTESNDTSVAE